MAKQRKTLNRFDSGIVEGPNSRDIADEASVSIEGFDPSTIGGLRPVGNAFFTNIPGIPEGGDITKFPAGFLMNQVPMANKEKGFGYGLYQWVSDNPNLWKIPGTRALDADGATVASSISETTNFMDSGSTLGEKYTVVYTVYVTPIKSGSMLGQTPADTSSGYENYYSPGGDDYPIIGRGYNAFGLYLHAYSPDDDGATVDKWCRLHRDVYIGAFNSGSIFDSRVSANNNSGDWNSYGSLDIFGTVQPYVFGTANNEGVDDDWITDGYYLGGSGFEEHLGGWRYRNLTADFQMQYPVRTYPLAFSGAGRVIYPSLKENNQDENDIDNALSPQYSDMRFKGFLNIENSQYLPNNFPLKPYLPKFYNVGDSIRMYDENQHGITYYIGHQMHGYSSNISSGIAGVRKNFDDDDNIYLANDGEQDDMFKVNQWVVAPNILMAPKITAQVATSKTALNTRLDATGVGHYGCSWTDIHFKEILSMNPDTAFAYTDGTSFWQRTSLDEFNNDEQYAVMGSNPARNPLPLYSGKIFSFMFVPSEEGGWLHDAGDIKLHATNLYDNGQEGPPAGNWMSNSPGYNIFPDNDCILKIGFAAASMGPNANGVEQLSAWTNGTAPGCSRYYNGPRIIGHRLYYSYSDLVGDTSNTSRANEDGNLYLMATVDFDKGYMIAGTNQWQTLGPGNWFEHTFLDPPVFEDFLSKNEYYPGEDIRATFKTAVHHKSRVFAGNVTKKGVRYPDRIIKSPVGMPDIFPDSGFIDVAGSEGDEIVHLEALGEELLIFKKREMQVLDITEKDNEKITQVHKGRGIQTHLHCVHTPHGVIFANRQGVLMYTQGEGKIQNLLETEGVAKISGQYWRELTGWDDNTTANIELAYSLENDKLIVNLDVIPTTDGSNHPNAGDVLIYQFGTTGWTMGRGVMPQSEGTNKSYCTNMITDFQGKVLFGVRDSDTAITNLTETDVATQWNAEWKGKHGTAAATKWQADGAQERRVKFYRWQEALDGLQPTDEATLAMSEIATGQLLLKTKDFTFDNMGAKKTLYKVYITYRVQGSGDSNIMCTYRVDGGSTDYHFATGSVFSDKIGTEQCYDTTSNKGLKETDSKFRTAELKPASRDECRKFNSIQFLITNPGGTVDRDYLNIDDITFIYKEHPAK